VSVPSKARTLLFDLDGTLTDSKAGIVRCLRFAVEELGWPCPPDDVLTTFIGPPLRRTFSTLLATADHAIIEQAVCLYRREFSAGGLFENRVYDGVPEMLASARSAARAAFVVTAKFTISAQRIVTHFGLAHHFAGVYGMEEGHADKAELLAHVLAGEAIAPDAAVMIGDRAADIQAAQANGVASIGVLWGYGSEQELRDARPDALCRTPADLASHLAAWRR